MKIYDFAFSPNCRKVRAVAYELGLTPEFVNVNLFTGEQRHASVVKVNPNAKVPILVDGDFVLWESNAIASYLAEGSALLPASGRERAEVQRWADWQLAQLGPAIRKVAFERLVKPMTGQGQPDLEVVEEGIAEYARWAGVLDVCLDNKEYVAGRLSVADFIVASVFTVGAAAGLEVATYPKVNAWLGRVLARDSMKRTLAEAQASVPRGQAMVALAS
jgi:glutathione S-transferase